MRKLLIFATAMALLPAGRAVQAQEDQVTLVKGTTVTAAVQDTITSARNKIGDVVSATLTESLKDEFGQVAFPAGSRVDLRIVDIKPADRNDTKGVIRLDIAGIHANGVTYEVDVEADTVAYETRKPGWTSDKKKLGIGAAAGAIIGGLTSGNLKGALVGGVLGAAVGAGVTHELSGRHVVVKPGTKVTFTVREPVNLTS